jgi:DNA primase
MTEPSIARSSCPSGATARRPPGANNLELPFPERLDFQEIKRQVAIEDVLAQRGLLGFMRRRGGRLTGNCPVHGGDNTTAFVVDRAKNVWFCFSGCGRGGDVIELVRLLDGVSHREAASRLAAMPRSVLPVPTQRRVGFQPFEQTLYLDPDVPWLRNKGISPSTARAYEAGAWRGRGMLAGCVAVRLHSPQGEPLGYAGRRLVPNGGKWVFPPSFPKSHVLYGHHRVDPLAPRLVVVECPWGVMRLAQAGIPAVALLGTALSDRQVELLSARHHVALLFDGDPAGRRGAREAARRLELAVDVTIVDLPNGRDPDDLSDTELVARVG